MEKTAEQLDEEVEYEMDEVVRMAKDDMSKWEERDNAEKEEVLEFGTEEGANVRVLGSWLGTKEDISNRKRRAGMLWGRVKEWLKGSKLLSHAYSPYLQS